MPLFPSAYLWHLSIFKPAYGALELYRDDPVILTGLLSMILQGLFFSWVFPKLFAGPGWIMNGLKFAAVFGLLGRSFLVLPVAAKFRMTSVSRFLLLETIFTALQFLATGLLLALVYRRRRSPLFLGLCCANGLRSEVTLCLGRTILRAA